MTPRGFIPVRVTPRGFIPVRVTPRGVAPVRMTPGGGGGGGVPVRMTPRGLYVSVKVTPCDIISGYYYSVVPSVNLVCEEGWSQSSSAVLLQ